MILLSVFLVPAAFVYYMAGRPESEIHFSRIAVIAGLVSGLCAVWVDHLFNPLVAMPVAGFLPRLLLIFLSDTLIPLAVGILPLWFLSLSSFRQKILSLRPQLFGIAAVYLPYKLFVFYDFPDVWSVLFIPAMDVSVLFIADFFLGKLLSGRSGTPDMTELSFALLPALIGLVIADFCKAMWYFCFPVWSFGLLSLLLIGFSFFLRLKKYNYFR
jgi:hypothetical protein